MPKSEHIKPPSHDILKEEWVLDAIGQGTVGAVETRDGKYCPCVTQENAIGDRFTRNEDRDRVARYIIDCHNALLGVPDPRAMIELLKAVIIDGQADYATMDVHRLKGQELVRYKRFCAAADSLATVGPVYRSAPDADGWWWGWSGVGWNLISISVEDLETENFPTNYAKWVPCLAPLSKPA